MRAGPRSLSLTSRFLRRVRLAAVLLVGAGVAAGQASACPFCTATTTLAQRIAEADGAYLVEWESGRTGDPDRSDPGSTTVRVLEVHQDKLHPRRVGERIELTSYSAGQPGMRGLLFGLEGDRGAMQWDGLMAVGPELLDYLRNQPAANLSNAERLPYFLEFLEHADEAIAVDAYGEFARCPYADVAALQDRLPREKLHAWISEPAPETGRIARRSFYGMLLGHCGGPADAEMLEQVILTPTDDFRVGIDGLMAGYLRLKGPAGLLRLQEHVFAPETAAIDVFALQQAIRFEWDFGQGGISRDQLRAALHPLLEDARFTELALVDLTRWEDLSIVDRPAALFDEPGFNDFEVQKAIVSYYLTVSQLDPANRPAEEQQAIAAAGKHLAWLRRRDPELVSHTERRARPAAAATATPAAAAATPPVAAIAARPSPAPSTRVSPDAAGWNPRWAWYPVLMIGSLLAWRRLSAAR